MIRLMGFLWISLSFWDTGKFSPLPLTEVEVRAVGPNSYRIRDWQRRLVEWQKTVQLGVVHTISFVGE